MARETIFDVETAAENAHPRVMIIVRSRPHGRLF
jgi:hypothetical protein